MGTFDFDEVQGLVATVRKDNEYEERKKRHDRRYLRSTQGVGTDSGPALEGYFLVAPVDVEIRFW